MNREHYPGYEIDPKVPEKLLLPLVLNLSVLTSNQVREEYLPGVQEKPLFYQ